MTKGLSRKVARSVIGDAARFNPLGELTARLSHEMPLASYRDDAGTLHLALLREHQAELIKELLAYSAQSSRVVYFLSEKGDSIELAPDSVDEIRSSLRDSRAWPALVVESSLQFRDVRKLRQDGRREIARVTFEFWHQGEGHFRTDNTNLYARRIPESFGRQKAFLSKRGPVFDFAELHECPIDSEVTFPIDIVYTWVNDEDPQWQAMFEATTGRPWSDPAARDRYRSREELRYSLRSVHRFASWAHRIFIVSNCAPPKWLDMRSEKIVWVDHTQIMDPSHLPTFNSHAIEASLHRIPGLSEHFLYLNDDFFFGRLQRPLAFFESNGVSRSFLEDYGVVNGGLQDASQEYLNAARNGKRLIEKRFGVSPTQLHEHVPYALRRSVLQRIEEEFPEELAATLASRFRSPSDVSVPSFLYHHYAFQERFASRSGELVGKLIKFTNPNYKARMKKLLINQDCDCFCINDGAGSAESAQWNQAVMAFLDTYFPEKSPYEV